MLRALEHAVDDTAVGIVSRIIENELGWLFTRLGYRLGVSGGEQGQRHQASRTASPKFP